ncbi:HisA/HisF family protein [Methanobacterium aggregans]|uniref:HisA/HisF family protein n=1 Tax=Methanobacterium aggregans TaxID=1615586 RepID=UPI001AE9A39B|nr:HisA/HisF family protein [Methanobacterium aggregans]MBP2045521.1 phosphoribosylformimino-5-aminoimidazole carboxamide ribotide isomerase [Methanobacterium aggregans]
MIIPVMDIKNGEAVSGKSGMRETYKPLKTVFSHSSDALEIAKSLKAAGAQRIYIADLDSIEGKGSNLQIVEEVNKIIPVMLDAGAGSVQMVETILKAADKVIIATETLKTLKSLDEIFESFSRDQLVLSIDIKNNEIFTRYLKTDINVMINKIKELNPDEIILLDISRVGTEKGVDFNLINKFHAFKSSIIMGGGILDDDIEELSILGVRKFLVGSALHSGRIRSDF